MFITHFKLSFSYPSSRKLSDIVKLRLVEKLPRRRIIEIWKQNYVENSWVHSDHISGDQYDCIVGNYRQNRNFVLPVRKGTNSYYNVFTQFISEKIVLMTALERFKQFSSSSRPILIGSRGDAPGVGVPSSGTPDLVVTLYDELKSSHDLVLIKMDIVNDKDINREESRVVLDNLLKFYMDFNLFKWVEKFNNRPKDFEFGDYIRQNNNIFKIY